LSESTKSEWFRTNDSRDTQLRTICIRNFVKKKFSFGAHVPTSAPTGVKFCLGSWHLIGATSLCHLCGVKNLKIASWVI